MNEIQNNKHLIILDFAFTGRKSVGGRFIKLPDLINSILCTWYAGYPKIDWGFLKFKRWRISNLYLHKIHLF